MIKDHEPTDLIKETPEEANDLRVSENVLQCDVFGSLNQLIDYN